MNKTILAYFFSFLAVLILPSLLWAQNLKWNKIEIQGNAAYNSTYLTNRFTANFVTGTYINTAIKTTATDKLKENENLLGATLNYGFLLHFKYVQSKNQLWDNTIFKVGLCNRNLFYSSLTADLVSLALNGNAPYLGSEMYLGTSKFTYLNFKELKFELEKFNVDSSVSFTGGLNLLAGNSFAKANVGDTRLYTATEISYTKAKLDYDVFITDTAKSAKKPYAVNGLGASVNFALTSYVHNQFLEKVTLSISDLGFINWNSKTIHLYRDTALYSQGIELKNINQLTDTNNTIVNTDSLKALLVKSEKVKHTIYLPVRVLLSFNTILNKSINIDYGVSTNPYAFAKNTYFVNANFAMSKCFKLITYTTYGGWGRLNQGLGYDWTIAKRLKTSAYCTNILPFIMGSSKTSGQGFYVSISKLF